MSSLRDIQIAQRKKDKNVEKKQKLVYSVLTAVNGSVVVPGKPYTNWHTPYGSENVAQILNRRVVPRPNLPVIIGKLPGSSVLEVLEVNISAMTNDNNFDTPFLVQHHKSHEWTGEDIVYVYPEAITPLMVYPSAAGGLLVDIIRGSYYFLGTEKTYSGTLEYNLASHVPAGPSEVRYVGLYLNASNTLQAIAGTVVASSTPDLSIPEPAWPDGVLKLAVVKLLDTTTALENSNIISRKVLWSTVANRSAWPEPGQILIGTTEYATLEDACTDAISGDLIKLGEGEFLVEASVPTGVNLIGSGRGITIIGNSATDTLTFAGLSYVANCTIYSDAGSAAIVTGQLIINNVEIAEGDIDCSGLLVAYNCSSNDLSVSGASTVQIFEGQVDDVTITAGDVYLYGPRASGTITGSPGVGSWWFDTNGDLQPGSTGGGVWPSPGKLNIGATEYATLALAIAAAVAGDTIYAGVGTHTCDDLTLPSGVNLVGGDRDATIFTTSTQLTTLTLGGANHVANITLTITTSDAADTRALRINTDVSEVINCKIITSNAGAGDSVGVYADSAAAHTNWLIGCYVESDYIGIVATSASQMLLFVQQCFISGVTASISMATSALVQCNASFVTGAVSVPTGVNLRGLFQDQDGTVYLRGTEAKVEQYELSSSPSINPYTGHWFSYFLSDGPYVKDDGGAVRKVLLETDITQMSGRLTLASGTPVTTTDQTAKTSILFSPYIGNYIWLYDGANWNIYPYAELSLSLAGFTADKNNDIFIYPNSGTPTIERVEWTNDTTRATALDVNNGVLIKNGAATRRYVGTFRTTGTTGQCEDSLAKRFVWNYYNRVERPMTRYYPYASANHTYNTAAWQAFNNNAASAQVAQVIGVSEDAVAITTYGFLIFASGNSTPYIACGVNTTTASTTIASSLGIVGSLGVWSNGVSTVRTGYNTFCPVELSTATGTAPTFGECQIDVLSRG